MTKSAQLLPFTKPFDHAAARVDLENRRRRLASFAHADRTEQVSTLLAEVDAALERLETPGFGACVRCRGSVEADRLRADPTTTVCLDCLTPAERRHLEHDLELAWRVQASLLPPRDFQTRGWTGHYLYRPQGAVSGDYVDVVPMDGSDESLLVMVGDVSGKGVAAALLMSHLHAVFHATASAGESLADIVSRANRLLCAASPSNAFATLAAARLLANGAVELCTAGHTPPLLVTPSSTRELAPDCVPLGLFCEARYQSRTLQLAPGESLLLYTDGVSESSDADGVELGSSGVRAAVEHASWRTPADLVRLVSERATQHRNGHSAQDDLSVMAISRRHASAS